MKREEAATRLDDTIPLSGGETPGAMENYELDKEALKMGAAALRSIAPLEEKMVALIEERDALQKRLDELERWAKAWVEWDLAETQRLWPDVDEPLLGWWNEVLDALNGSMTWPEKEKP